MKKYTSLYTSRALCRMLAFAVLMLACACLDGAMYIDFAAGATLAMAAPGLIDSIITTDKVRDVATKLDMTDIEAAVTILFPEKSLLQSLIADYGRKEPADSDIYRWYTEGYVPFVDKTYNSTGTVQTVTMGTSLNLQVETPDHYEKNQTLYVDDPTLVSATNGHLELFVRSVSAAGVDVVLTNGVSGQSYDIPDGTPLIFAGVAKSELDWNANTKVVMPQDLENYIQIFMGEVFLSERQNRIKKEINYGMKDLFRQVVNRFKFVKEMSMLFGSGESVQDSIANNRKQISKGLLNFDIQKFQLPTTWNKNSIVEFISKCYNAPDSSDQKFVLMGGNLIDSLETALLDTNLVTRYRPTSDKDGTFNIMWTTLHSSKGLLHIKHHQMFDMVGKRNMAISIDPAYIGQATLIPMEHHSNTLDDNRKGQKVNAASELVREEACLTVYSPQTHTYWFA